VQLLIWHYMLILPNVPVISLHNYSNDQKSHTHDLRYLREKAIMFIIERYIVQTEQSGFLCFKRISMFKPSLQTKSSNLKGFHI